MKILLIAEHLAGQQIKPATRNAVSAARQFGEHIDALVAGENITAAVAQLAGIAGVNQVLSLEHSAFAHSSPELLAPVIASIAADYDVIISAAGTLARDVLPRVAALLDVNLLPDVVEIVGSDTFVRPTYAGNVLASLQSLDHKKVISVRAPAFAPAADQTPAPIKSVVVSLPEQQVSARWMSEQQPQTDRPELTNARVVVSGGRALGSAAGFEALIGPLARKLNAAVGASRAAVDEGFAPNEAQVGQTGVVVAPELYIAVGISGAVQHLAGMKDSGVVVAINSDPDAPIFQHADYSLVGDLFSILPELTAKLS